MKFNLQNCLLLSLTAIALFSAQACVLGSGLDLPSGKNDSAGNGDGDGGLGLGDGDGDGDGDNQGESGSGGAGPCTEEHSGGMGGLGGTMNADSYPTQPCH